MCISMALIDWEQRVQGALLWLWERTYLFGVVGNDEDVETGTD